MERPDWPGFEAMVDFALRGDTAFREIDDMPEGPERDKRLAGALEKVESFSEDFYPAVQRMILEEANRRLDAKEEKMAV